MDDARVVRRFDPLGDLPTDVERVANRKSAVPQPVGERLPWNELHDEKALAIVLLEAMQRRDPRVIERCEHPGLTLETSQSLRIPRLRVRQEFESDVSPQRSVPCAINLSPAASAEQGEDLVAADSSPHPRWRKVLHHRARRDIER